LEEGIDSSSDPSMRRALMPLKLLAQETGCSIVLVCHLNKDTGKGALDRGLGSVAYGGVARVVLGLGKKVDDPPDTDDRYLLMLKGNHERIAPPLKLTITRTKLDGIKSAKLELVGVADVAEEDIFGKRKGRPKDGDVRLFIREMFGDRTKVPTSELKKAAADRGLAWRTVTRVMGELEIKPSGTHGKAGGGSDFAWVRKSPFLTGEAT
jgi:hypothetical protein